MRIDITKMKLGKLVEIAEEIKRENTYGLDAFGFESVNNTVYLVRDDYAKLKKGGL